MIIKGDGDYCGVEMIVDSAAVSVAAASIFLVQLLC